MPSGAFCTWCGSEEKGQTALSTQDGQMAEGLGTEWSVPFFRVILNGFAEFVARFHGEQLAAAAGFLHALIG